MDAPKPTRTGSGRNRTTIDRTSDCELVVTRTFNGPAHLVFQAWTTPDLLARWWVPQSIDMVMVSCAVDARVGGSYRFEFTYQGSQPFAFFGRYREVVENARLV